MKSIKKIVTLSVVAGLLVGSMGVAVHNHYNPTVVEVEKLVPVEVPVIKEVPGPTVYVDKEVKVEVPVEDVAFKTMACDRLHYDVVADCVKEVKAEDEALKLAFAEIENSFAQELKDADLVSKSKYAELVKTYDKFEDLEVTESDFDAGDYSFEIKAKIKDTNKEDKFNVMFSVDVRDGEAEIKNVELI